MLADLPGFAAAEGLNRVNGDEGLYRRLLFAFADSHAGDVPRVRAALDAGDVEAAFKLVHAIKGAAGNLGATALFTAAKEFQVVLQERESGAYESNFAAFDRRMNEFRAALGKGSGEKAAPAAPPETAARSLEGDGKQRVLDQLSELTELMAGRNMRSVDLVEAIGEQVAGCGLDDEMEALQSALMMLDFAKGAEAADVLAGRIQDT